MSGKLLIRFDDLCPTMNWRIWERIEPLLCETGVKPLVAVIPDNRDPEFQFAPARHDFWDRVRHWQSLGWTIGLHGYQHSYVTRCSGLLGINLASEFAGLPVAEQERKIQLALDIFRREGLAPRVFVAPGHSFDTTTVELLPKAGLHIISDGLSLFPYRDKKGILWIPQQMWRFRRMPFGVWTVCLHPNSWQPGAVDRFRNQLMRFRHQICSLDEVVGCYKTRERSAVDSLTANALNTALRLKRVWRGLAATVRNQELAIRNVWRVN